jgi:TrmH family RNA methyltransferase
VAQAQTAGATVHLVGWQIVKAISDSVTPQGMVAVIGSPLRGLQGIERSSDVAVVLGGVSDPGNVGTLVRTAAAADADAVVLTEGSADPLNPKTARASAAALFATTLVADVSLESTAARLKELGYRLLGADSAAQTSLYDVDLSGPIAVVLGNESWGLPESQRDLLDTVVSIPMPGPMESLNVATAGSVIVFEILRQRRQGPTVSSGNKEAVT